jgi:hypothetical protein
VEERPFEGRAKDAKKKTIPFCRRPLPESEPQAAGATTKADIFRAFAVGKCRARTGQDEKHLEFKYPSRLLRRSPFRFNNLAPLNPPIPR